MASIPNISAAELRRIITFPELAKALQEALIGGLEPGAEAPRSVIDVTAGQLLLMPSESLHGVGVKAVTVAPRNADLGIPRVHGSYLLFTRETLELAAIMDGAEISVLRTPAVAMAAAEPALTRFSGRPVAVLVFGAGPQAVGFVEALLTGAYVPVGSVTYVARQVDRARTYLAGFPQLAVDDGWPNVIEAGTPRVDEAVRAADVIICVTSSTTPVFNGRLVRDGAVVMAIGAHLATIREVDGDLMARAEVLVEDVATSLREAGDVVIAVAEGKLDPAKLIPMTAVLRGERTLDPERVLVFKSVGMSWEDLVVAEAVMANYRAANGANA